MAGTLGIFQRCYLGMVARNNSLWLDPHLPEELKRLKFSIWYREHFLKFNVTPKILEIASANEAVAPIRIRLPSQSFNLRPGEVRRIRISTEKRKYLLTRRRRSVRKLQKGLEHFHKAKRLH
jgi:trehalose/maltose hydrolase-like predicted phosphorylase